MSSDCPLKGEQCIKRFQNQAFWGLHSFGSNFAVISPSWVKCMKEGRGKWGCLRGILPRHWSKSGFFNKENKTWNLTYIAKKNGSTASYSIFSEHKSKLIDLQDFSVQWSKVQVKRALLAWSTSSSSSTPSSSSFLTWRAGGCGSSLEPSPPRRIFALQKVLEAERLLTKVGVLNSPSSCQQKMDCPAMALWAVLSNTRTVINISYENMTKF